MTSDGPQRQVHRRSADKTKFLEVRATASGSALANHKLAVPRVPVPKNESLYNESSCGGWIEFRDPALEGLFEVRVVLVGMLADELDGEALAFNICLDAAKAQSRDAKAIISPIRCRNHIGLRRCWSRRFSSQVADSSTGAPSS
jgi:hypothetical protein